jgi:hypothetical protein
MEVKNKNKKSNQSISLMFNNPKKGRDTTGFSANSGGVKK